MQKRNVGFVLLVLGVVLAVLALAADVSGLGGSIGFGRQQTIALVVGVVLAVVGGWLLRKR